MAEWFEDDLFWETMAPHMFGPRRMEGTPEEVDQIIDLLEVEPGARILDMACGPGRHTLELARRDFRVTGVDRTTAYLEHAREQAVDEGLEIEFAQADMREFRRPEAFDAAVNLFTSFGFFEDPSDDLRVVRNLYDSLKPGGRLLVEMSGKEVLARIFRERDWQESDDGVLFLEERKLRNGWSWIDSRWIRIDGTQREEFELGVRLYSGAELATLLHQVRFASVKLYGGLDASPYDQHARRLAALAQKAVDTQA